MKDTGSFSAHPFARSSGTRPRAVIGFACMLLFALVLAACGGQPAGAAPVSTQAATTGADLFRSLDCIHCHKRDDRGSGPALAGLEGKTISLANGEILKADEQYIRTSILDPRAHVRAGYRPKMPSYEGRVSDEELSKLVEYIRSLEGGVQP